MTVKKRATKTNPNHNSNKERDITTRTSSDWDFIAAQLRTWSQKETSDIIEEFHVNLDIPSSTYYANIKTNETLKAAHEYAMAQLGIRAEKHCKKHNLAMSSVVASTLPHYLDRWKKDVEWRAELRAKNAAQASGGNVTFNVEMPEINKTDEVDKQLKKKKDAK